MIISILFGSDTLHSQWNPGLQRLHFGCLTISWDWEQHLSSKFLWSGTSCAWFYYFCLVSTGTIPISPFSTYILFVIKWQWFFFYNLSLSLFLSNCWCWERKERKFECPPVAITIPLAAATRSFSGINLSPSVHVILTSSMTLSLVMSCCAFLHLNWAFFEAQIMNRLVLCRGLKKGKKYKWKRELWSF